MHSKTKRHSHKLQQGEFQLHIVLQFYTIQEVKFCRALCLKRFSGEMPQSFTYARPREPALSYKLVVLQTRDCTFLCYCPTQVILYWLPFNSWWWSLCAAVFPLSPLHLLLNLSASGYLWSLREEIVLGCICTVIEAHAAYLLLHACTCVGSDACLTLAGSSFWVLILQETRSAGNHPWYWFKEKIESQKQDFMVKKVRAQRCSFRST